MSTHQPQPTVLWAPTELAYFAGLMDGEGSFCILPRYWGKARKPAAPFTRLSMSSTTPELLYWVQQRFSGLINRHPTSKKGNEAPALQWRMKRKTVLLMLLPQLIPFLVLKKPQAQLMLEFLRRFDKEGPRNAFVPDWEREAQADYCRLMKGLNARGRFSAEEKALAKAEVLYRDYDASP